MDGEKHQGPMVFRILQSSLAEGASARLGRLRIPGRKDIDTPTFFATTSRGVVPHLTPDNVSRYLPFQGALFGLEDFIERYQKEPRAGPAISDIPISSEGGSRLRAFTALPSDVVSVLAPRRFPAGASHLPNGPRSITVFTSHGYEPLTTSTFSAAADSLRPDITIPIADLTYSDNDRTPSSKRAVRMADRTEDWTVEFFKEMTPNSTAIFAPTLPIPYPLQWSYLTHLAELQEAGTPIAGLAVYDVDVLPDIESNHPSLAALPRLSLDGHAAKTPHQVLRQVSLGADILVLPCANAASDEGLAFTFTFPPPQSHTSGELLPLAIDLSLPEHSTSLIPLSEGCICYTCTSHHRAYITHLLDAREMLAWTLLQIHNHHVLTNFFAAIRESLAESPNTTSVADGSTVPFEKASRAFALAYETELPEGKATKPRARGYQFASTGGDERRNKPAWDAKAAACGAKKGDSDVMIIDDAVPSGPGTGTGTPAESNAAGGRSGVETPLVPDADAAELRRKGFAEVVEEGQAKKARFG